MSVLPFSAAAAAASGAASAELPVGADEEGAAEHEGPLAGVALQQASVGGAVVGHSVQVVQLPVLSGVLLTQRQQSTHYG